ncbi:hypothetical protein TEA_003489 [Camellia sinensis var. sinensis]|uniref:Fcf2 pre-rRNA processing C-terminal domain-containing protein n=1 Tax=Camellia sinensis var. sinensis TaxID=542762 RepID=A0A4S4CY11_CAMSN|nr:hypothetical protein TEA_003489 [Camellia sinensis var. sinensis]
MEYTSTLCSVMKFCLSLDIELKCSGDEKGKVRGGLFVPPNNPKKLHKLLRKQFKDTAGKNWFDMVAQTLIPELKKDLQLLKLRSVGTVIESASDFFTGRLTKKERKATLADELLSDHTLGEYRKRKVRESEEQNHPGGVEKWKIKGGQSWKRAKQRRR